MVFKSPVGGDKQLGRRLRHEPLDGYTGREPLGKVDGQVDILVNSVEVEILRTHLIFPSHVGMPNQLQLMQFEGIKRELRQTAGRV